MSSTRARPSIWSYLFHREYNLSKSCMRKLSFGKCEKYVKDLSELYASEKSSVVVKCNLKGYTKTTFGIIFDRDGSRMASLHGDHSIRITCVSTGRTMKVLRGHPRSPWTAEFHQTFSNIMASGCLGGEVRIWDLSSGACDIWQSPTGNSITSVSLHPTQKILLIAQGNTIHVWEWGCTAEPVLYASPRRKCENVKWVQFAVSGEFFYSGITTSAEYDSWNILRQPPSVFELRQQQQRGESAARARNQYHASLNTTVTLSDMLGNPLEISNDLLVCPQPAASETGDESSSVDVYHAATTFAQLHQIHTGEQNDGNSNGGVDDHMDDAPQSNLNASSNIFSNSGRSPRRSTQKDNEEGRSANGPTWSPSTARAAQTIGVFGAALLAQAIAQDHSGEDTGCIAQDNISLSEKSKHSRNKDTNSTGRSSSAHSSGSSKLLSPYSNESNEVTEKSSATPQPGASASQPGTSASQPGTSTSSVNKRLEGPTLFGASIHDRLASGSSSSSSNSADHTSVTTGTTTSTTSTLFGVDLHQSLSIRHAGSQSRNSSSRARQMATSRPPIKRPRIRALDAFDFPLSGSMPSSNGQMESSSAAGVFDPPVESDMSHRFSAVRPPVRNGERVESPSSVHVLQDEWINLHRLVGRLEGSQGPRRFSGSVSDLISRLESVLNVPNDESHTRIMNQLHIQCLICIRKSSQSNQPISNQLVQRLQTAADRLECLIQEYGRLHLETSEMLISPEGRENTVVSNARDTVSNDMANRSTASRPGVSWTRGLRLNQSENASHQPDGRQQTNGIEIQRSRQRNLNTRFSSNSIYHDNIMNRNQRIQKWRLDRKPEYLDSPDNIIVHRCKIHNDCGIDISQDGKIMAVFVQNPNLAQVPGFYGGTTHDTLLRIISLETSTLGDVLHQFSLGVNPVSISISPLSNFVVIGLAGYRTPNDLSMIMYDIYKIPSKSGTSPKVTAVRSIQSAATHSTMVNCIKWLPHAGQGLIVGTNQGDVIIHHTIQNHHTC